MALFSGRFPRYRNLPSRRAKTRSRQARAGLDQGSHEAATVTQSQHFPWASLLALAFMPFALGYFLSYLYRTVNATIAFRIMNELGLNAAQLGLLTAAYFFGIAIAQLPLGVALDRYGPRRVQAVLLCIAAAGSLVYALASGFVLLFLGRALIGAGVSGALMAGLKSNVQFFPKNRLALLNGAFIAVGASGAVAATAPIEWLLQRMDWRDLFAILGMATFLTAALIFFAAPEVEKKSGGASVSITFRAIYMEPRFVRLAPLSAICLGSAWALQGLWAAPWLADAGGLEREAVVGHLFVMAVSLCLGAALAGMVAQGLHRFGLSLREMFAGCAALLIAAELTLAFHLPLPPLIAWSVIAAMGAMTVVSYGMMAEVFPKEVAGRANAALNILHIVGAFLIQTGVGMIVVQWSQDALGRYPAGAYAAALITLAALQFAALLFFLPRSRGVSEVPAAGGAPS